MILDNEITNKEKIALNALKTLIASAGVRLILNDDFPQVNSTSDLPVMPLLENVMLDILASAEDNIKFVATSFQLQQYEVESKTMNLVKFPLDILYCSITASAVSRNSKKTLTTNQKYMISCFALLPNSTTTQLKRNLSLTPQLSYAVVSKQLVPPNFLICWFVMVLMLIWK
jgi:hypothetical protein